MDEARHRLQQILILTETFPPYDAGKLGSSIRVFSMADYFARSGYQVHVAIPRRHVQTRAAPPMHPAITLHLYWSAFRYYSHSPAASLSFFHRLAKYGIAIVRRISGVIRGTHRLPVGRHLFRTVCAVVDAHNITTVIASAPPVFAGQLGVRLKARYGDSLRFVYDFRDLSWMHPTVRAKSPALVERQKNFELDIAKRADMVTVVSTGMQQALDESGAHALRDKVHVVENGFAHTKPVPPQSEVASFVDTARREGRVVLYYAGSGVLPDQRGVTINTHKTLHCLLGPLVSDDELATKFALVLQGVIRNTDTYFAAYTGPLKWLAVPPVENAQVRANMQLADVGVATNEDRIYSPLIMGGKVYDYISCGLALLLIYPDNAHSLFEFARRHGNKPWFADIEKPGSVAEQLAAIAADREELARRKFSAAEAAPYARDNQYARLKELIEDQSTRATRASRV